jgi:hypothetical protein
MYPSGDVALCVLHMNRPDAEGDQTSGQFAKAHQAKQDSQRRGDGRKSLSL